jgi:hypothetical protein
MLRVAVFLLVFFFAPPALACGGFMASRMTPGQTSAPELRSDGSKVALLRDGLHTVVSLSMRYRGPPNDFALVVPVPVVLQKESVRTLHAGTFERLDAMSRPELVEQWEKDPCWTEYVDLGPPSNSEGGTGTRARGEEGSSGGAAVSAVKIEAAFSVDEYDVVILGASDSVSLERWLIDAGYALPPGIEPFLRPYVAAGSKFFVAKVDARKIELSWGRAVLSPIRFEYDSETFSLPIRLGLANVDGEQDLTVYVLGRGTRYEAANYENTTIPTNLRLVEGAKGRFAGFYEKLFVDTIAKHPKSFVTEYAMAVDACVECEAMLKDLGAADAASSTLVLSRLHTRYGAAFAQDLVLRTAPPIEGGAEPYDSGELPNAAGRPAPANRFRGRYFVRHPWLDAVDCSSPSFGTWTGTDTGFNSKASLPASTPLEQWTFRGEEPSHAHTSLFEKVGRLVRVDDATFVVPLLVVLIIAIGVLVWRARRLGASRWRTGLLMLLVGAAPALTLVSQASLHSVLMAPLPIYQGPLYIAAAAMVIALGNARAAKEPSRMPSGLEAAVALAPVLVALVAYRLQLSFLEGILLGVRDADQALRVVAEGEGECLESIALGACGTVVLLGVAAWDALAAPSERAAEVATLGAGRWAIALAVGAAANVLVFVSARHAEWVRVMGAPAFLFGLVLARRLEARKPASIDSKGESVGVPSARRPFGERALALAATWLLAMLVIGLVCISSTRALSLQAVAGESVDPSQRGRILLEDDALIRALAWQVPVAAFASVVAPAWLALRNRARSSVRAAPLAPVALALVACAALWGSARSTIARLYASQEPPRDERAIVQGVEPVAIALDERLRLDHVLDGPSLLATRAGSLLASPNATMAPRPFDDATWTRMASDTLREPNDPLLVVDRSLTVGRLDAALDPVLQRRHMTFRWLLGQRGPAGTGVYGLLGAWADDRAAVALEWRRKVVVEPPRPNDPEAMMVPEAVAVRLQPGALETLYISGVHGRYRRFESTTIQRVPFDDPGPPPSFPSMLPENSRVVEVVVCVTPDTDVSTLTALVRSFIAAPPYEGGWGARPSRWLSMHPVLRFVVTTDLSPFAP